MRVEVRNKRKNKIKDNMEVEIRVKTRDLVFYIHQQVRGGMYDEPPGADVALEYPRQQIVCYLIHDIINSGV